MLGIKKEELVLYKQGFEIRFETGVEEGRKKQLILSILIVLKKFLHISEINLKIIESLIKKIDDVEFLDKLFDEALITNNIDEFVKKIKIND